jgi:hypothetical protein
MKTSRFTYAAILSLRLTALAGVGVRAQESEQRVRVHGFGELGIRQTNGNQYLAGDREGRYDDASFTLNVGSSVTDCLRMVA